MDSWSAEHSCSELSLQPASSPWHPATRMVLKGVCAVMVMFFDVWICLFSQKSIASISLWLLCIERVGLKLPNYKSHTLAWNSLCVMMSFSRDCLHEIASFLYGSQWRSCAGSTMFRLETKFSKKSIGGVFLFFFSTDRLELRFPI